jgi:hypothetical protein
LLRPASAELPRPLLPPFPLLPAGVAETAAAKDEVAGGAGGAGFESFFDFGSEALASPEERFGRSLVPTA